MCLLRALNKMKKEHVFLLTLTLLRVKSAFV